MPKPSSPDGFLPFLDGFKPSRNGKFFVVPLRKSDSREPKTDNIVSLIRMGRYNIYIVAVTFLPF